MTILLLLFLLDFFVFEVLSVMYYPTRSFTIIKHTTPGIPNKPTIKLVIKFNPMWNPKFAPIRFIKYIVNPPSIEFKTNFIIFCIGTIKIFPNIKIKQTHAKNVIMFVSIKIPSLSYFTKKGIYRYESIFLSN